MVPTDARICERACELGNGPTGMLTGAPCVGSLHAPAGSCASAAQKRQGQREHVPHTGDGRRIGRAGALYIRTPCRLR